MMYVHINIFNFCIFSPLKQENEAIYDQFALIYFAGLPQIVQLTQFLIFL